MSERVLELRDPDRERRKREERDRLVVDGAMRTAEAVGFSGLSRSKLYELQAAGRIRAIKIDGKRLWPRAELRRLLADGVEDAAGG
jgi:hypothetical protein